MTEKQNFYGWKLLGVVWFLYFLNMGFPLYGGIIANVFMLKQIVMSRYTFGMSFTLFNFFTGVPSFLVSASILKWGIRKTYVIGTVLLILGGLMMAFWVSQPWQYLLSFGCVMGLGICFCTIIPTSTTVTRWFVRYRGRAIGIALTASGFSGFVAAPVLNKIMTLNGGNWRQGYLVIVGMVVLAGVIAFVFIKERPEDLGQFPDGIPADKLPAQDLSKRLLTSYAWTPAEAYRTPAYWLIVLGCLGSSYPFYWAIAHLVLHLKGVGFSPAIAAFSMGLYTMGGIAGRLIGGWLMDKIAARYAFILGLLLPLIGSVLAIGLNGKIVMMAYVTAILLGAGFGWTFSCMNTVLANFFGPASFPKTFGMLMIVTTIICAPSGAIGGKLFDLYKSYTPALEVNIVLCIISIVALMFARAPQPKTARQ